MGGISCYCRVGSRRARARRMWERSPFADLRNDIAFRKIAYASWATAAIQHGAERSGIGHCVEDKPLCGHERRTVGPPQSGVGERSQVIGQGAVERRCQVGRGRDARRQLLRRKVIGDCVASRVLRRVEPGGSVAGQLFRSGCGASGGDHQREVSASLVDAGHPEAEKRSRPTHCSGQGKAPNRSLQPDVGPAVTEGRFGLGQRGRDGLIPSFNNRRRQACRDEIAARRNFPEIASGRVGRHCYCAD
jgi:hypothetical protein